MYKLKIKSIQKLDSRPVYDLSVDGTHNFFVGKTKILTSNCDRLTPDAQGVLRNLMETYSHSTRFILTCNYQEKITPAIKSRCQSFEIKPPSKPDIMAHLVKILDNEKVKYTPKDVVFIVNSYYPDLRKMINFAQQSSLTGELKIAKANTADQDFREKLLELLKQPNKAGVFNEIRQIVADAQFSNYEEVYKYLFDHVNDYAGLKAPEVILNLADAVYQSALVFEREITFVAMMHRILATLNTK
jgi:replication factor C small subunit